MRLGLYAGVSASLATACLLRAFHQRPNFYSATVYLFQSNACLLIITNLLLVLACSFMYALQRLLYGPLRPIEMEQLSEKAWYAVLDTLLAMPAFREDVGGWLLTMFVLLLAGKVWGWIAEGRVDILEQQPPANPRLFHARLATSLLVSVIFDLYMLSYCVDTVLANPRPGMMVIFTFEFAVLSVFSIFTLSRYGLSVADTMIQKKQMEEAIKTRKDEIRVERIAARQNETADGSPAPASPPNDEPIEVDENEVDIPGWEEKRRYLFALEVFTDFVKLIIYVVFFTVSITFNGLPMHIMRDVYMTFASFSKRVTDYVAYRKATSDMNTRYPDATTEEIREDSCIVCRETMVAWEQPAPAAAEGEQAPAAPAAPAARRDEGLRAKKLPCGHILHLRCLKAWLERQQVCPTCRRPVVSATTEPQAQAGAPGAAPGAPPGQPGQPGQAADGVQRRAARQNRARIFNLGPVRIGFLNGNAGQLQQVVNQLGNQLGDGQNAPVDGQHNAAGGVAQGPNHLGLQVPYLPGAAGQTGHPGAVSTQIQLMQIEQRLIQDAHNLQVEQQQLATLRLMEAELARLRANHVPNQQPVGMSTIGQAPGFNPAAPQPFHGSTNQQFGAGHANLPQGMTLPEGWSVIPLQRMDGGQSVGQSTQTQASQTAPGQAPPITTTTNGVQGLAPIASVTSTAAPQATAPQDDPAGPTDDNGSPLFVPTPTPTTNGQTAPSEPANPPPAEPVESNPAPTVSSESGNAPWSNGEGSGWGFNAAESDAPTQGNGDDTSESSDKGKGKAAAVEDVPDPEA